MSYSVKGDMSPTDLGEICKRIREEHLEMSQEDLAIAVDVKLPTLQAVEQGKGNHVYNTLMKICKKYKLKTACLIKT